MIAGYLFNPVEAHQTDATISTATTLTRPSGADVIRLQAFSQAIRYTLDNTTPTATTGFRLAVNELIEIPLGPGGTVRVIEESATGSVQWEWGKMLPIAGNRPARS